MLWIRRELSGLTSPDVFEVRHEQGRVSPSIVKKLMGKKELRIHVGENGGTIHSTNEESKITTTDTNITSFTSPTATLTAAPTLTVAAAAAVTNEFCISDSMVVEIVRELLTIVKVYGNKPMDRVGGRPAGKTCVAASSTNHCAFSGTEKYGDATW